MSTPEGRSTTLFTCNQSKATAMLLLSPHNAIKYSRKSSHVGPCSYLLYIIGRARNSNRTFTVYSHEFAASCIQDGPLDPLYEFDAQSCFFAVPFFHMSLHTLSCFQSSSNDSLINYYTDFLC